MRVWTRMINGEIGVAGSSQKVRVLRWAPLSFFGLDRVIRNYSSIRKGHECVVGRWLFHVYGGFNITRRYQVTSVSITNE